MFPVTQGTAQVYSLFGSWIIEQHDVDRQRRFVDDLPRPDLDFGEKHPLWRGQSDQHS